MRFYLAPVAGDGSHDNPRRPKYFVGADRVPLIAGNWQGMDYGHEPVMVVSADTTPAEHAAISAQPDVWATPDDLDQTLGGELPTVRARLEALNIPAHHLDAHDTYKAVLRWLTQLFAIHQRYAWLTGGQRFVDAGLDAPYGGLDGQRFHVMRSVAFTFGLAWPPGFDQMPLRAVLKHLADQLPFSRLTGEIG